MDLHLHKLPYRLVLARFCPKLKQWQLKRWESKSGGGRLMEIPIKLKESQLYKHSHYGKLIDDIIEYVIPFWNSKWRFKQELSGILNKEKLVMKWKNLCTCFTFVLKMINSIIDNNKENDKLSIPIIDLCSGKGILSMLIVSFIKLVPKYQQLC